MGRWWRLALVSLNGVAPSRMAGVSASVNLPSYHKVQKLIRVVLENGHKMVVVWRCCCQLPGSGAVPQIIRVKQRAVDAHVVADPVDSALDVLPSGVHCQQCIPRHHRVRSSAAGDASLRVWVTRWHKHKAQFTHTTILWLFFRDYPGKPVPEEIFWTFMVQRKITETDTLTIRLGTTPSGLNSDPSSSSPMFWPDALPVAALPLYPGLRQAPNMLACIAGRKHWLLGRLANAQRNRQPTSWMLLV